MKFRIQIVLIFTLCVMALIGGYFAFLRDKSEDSANQSVKFKNAPSFRLPDAQGKTHELKDFQGNLVLLHFWASWCPPCLDEIQEWVELGIAFKGKKLKLIAISLDQNWADAQKILPSQKLNAQVISLLDLSGQIPDLFGTYQYPETYLISPDQKILTKWVGPQDWSGAQIRGFIQKILDELK